MPGRLKMARHGNPHQACPDPTNSHLSILSCNDPDLSSILPLLLG
jgi:hypothetical protein